jgi:radical SAM enzyme (rSAM/lipoprotein system)
MPGKIAQFLFNQYKHNEAKIHEINYLFWECTWHCNLQCRHCGSDCSSHSETQDMPFDDFLKAILPLKNVYKHNSIFVAITGGEPLLRQDLPQCGITLREHGFRWGIVTNGYDYTLNTQKKLLAAGIESLTLSIDGFEDSHNWLRANNKSFARAIRALDIINGADHLYYDVVTCVNRKNIRELPGFKEFLISKRVKTWRLFCIAPIGRAENNGDMLLNGDELTYLMDFISEVRSKDHRISIQLGCGAYTGKYEGLIRDSFFFCRAGIHVASVLIDGSISACPNINRHFVQGNIYQDDFLEIWNNRFGVMRNRKWTKTGICSYCKDYKNCNGGPMHLWGEKKDSPLVCVHHKMSITHPTPPALSVTQK